MVSFRIVGARMRKKAQNHSDTIQICIYILKKTHQKSKKQTHKKSNISNVYVFV